MLHLPNKMLTILENFSPIFTKPAWKKVKILLIGAILAPAGRTVASTLRAMGLDREGRFQNYHLVLNRDHLSSREFSRILLCLLLRVFQSPDEPVVVGIDETIERRRGKKISAKGIYRDPVRSSENFFVKTSGLRWISMAFLPFIPWAKRVWALPFFTVLAPSERYHTQRKKHHKTIGQWASQMILQQRRWLPKKDLVIVGDGTYAIIELVAFCIRMHNPVTLIARLRLDAALYDPAPVPVPGIRGRPRKKRKAAAHLGQSSP